jgi:hypothetical protein
MSRARLRYQRHQRSIDAFFVANNLREALANINSVRGATKKIR